MTHFITNCIKTRDNYKSCILSLLIEAQTVFNSKLSGLTFRQRHDLTYPVVKLRCCGNNYLGALLWCFSGDASELCDALNQNHIKQALRGLAEDSS